MSKGAKILITILAVLVIIVAGFSLAMKFVPGLEDKVLDLIAGTKDDLSPEVPIDDIDNTDPNNEEPVDDIETNDEEYIEEEGDIKFKKEKSSNKYSVTAGFYTFDNKDEIDGELGRMSSGDLPSYGISMPDEYGIIHLTREDYFSTNISNKEEYDFVNRTDGINQEDNDFEFKYFREPSETFTKNYTITFSKNDEALQPGDDNDYYTMSNYFKDNTGKESSSIEGEFSDYNRVKSDVFEYAFVLEGDNTTFDYKYVGINSIKKDVSYYRLDDLEENYFENIPSLENDFTHTYFEMVASDTNEEDFASLLNAMTVK